MSLRIQGFIVQNDDREIYDWFGLSSTAPMDVDAAIEEAAGGLLDVEITTCYGGDVFAGSDMYSKLRAYKGGVQIRITGLAASAASVIAMAGPSEMSPTAQLMVHRVSTMADGNFHDMDKASDALKQADKSVAAAYVAKSGMSEHDALQMMDKETWITAAQAVEMHLVDRVTGSGVPEMAAAYGTPLPRAVIEKTRSMLTERKRKDADAQAAKEKLDRIEREIN